MDQRASQLLQDIERLDNMKKQLRRREREIKDRETRLSGLDQQIGSSSIKSLESNLKSFLPSSHVPGNVGALTKVSWPFWFQTDFDFGTNPTLTVATQQTQSFQVTQESAFIIRSISLDYQAYTTAGFLGPWVADFRDRQSSRYFNDISFPLQTIGTKSNPTILPTPMLLMPNAFFDVTVKTFLTGVESQATTGEGKFQFSFFGSRIRVEDADKVLSSIFG